MTLGANQIAAEVSAFAERMTPARARWEYALTRITHGDRYNFRAVPVIARFVGISSERTEMRLGAMTRHGGFDRAAAWYEANFPDFIDPFAVGPIEPWQIGHVYFVRLRDYPHVAKVGFSRRVPERLKDIESKAKQRLTLDRLEVGTLADEHWWHHSWRSLNISGEWFYWPGSTARSLPPFLAQREAA